MDILIYTEVENRELDAACLIKAEMEKRGYSVAIQRYNRICNSGTHFAHNPKMIILPWLYGEEFLHNFINDNNKGKLKVVNLQSEQVLSENFVQNNYHMPKESCKYGYHLAWGNATKERFISAGISEENIFTVGNINIDFNAEKFLDVYYTKDEIASQFGLDCDKDWVLFISSFTHPSMTPEERNSYIERFPFLKEFVEISTNSQKELISWFERFAKENPDKVFIYRPHPTELKNDNLINLSNQYSNFKVISSLSIRQWVKVCEHNTTWFSTSIADVYYQNKDCAVLRPYSIPHNADCEIFYDCVSETTYDDFLNFVNRKEKIAFPISKDKIEYFYGTNPCGTNYTIFCDYLEKILKSNYTMPPLSVNSKFLSKLHRNCISFFFFVNNYVNITKLPFISKNTHLVEQLNEKRSSYHNYKKYRKNLINKLKELI